MQEPPIIGVIGATGATGQQVCRSATQSGYRVVAVVRTPAAFSQPGVEVRRADVSDLSSLCEALEGVDAVIGCFGVSGLRRALAATTLYSAGIKSVIQAMEYRGISRLVMLSSAGVLHGSTNGFLWNRILRPLCWRMYADISEMEVSLAQSNLSWTLVRPPQLVDRENDTLEIREDAPPDGPTQLGRRVLAEFMVRTTVEPDAVRKKLTVMRSFFHPEAV